MFVSRWITIHYFHAQCDGSVLKRRLKESAGLKAFESESSTVDGD